MSTFIKASRQKYRIKASKSRLEFEKILRKIGCKDRSPIQTNIKQLTIPLLQNTELEGMVSGFYIFYPNKKSYLYDYYSSRVSHMKYRKLVKYLRLVYNEIDYKEKTRICEVGWRVELGLRTIQFSVTDRARLYLNVLRCGKKILKNGNELYTPRENDMLISYPDGPHSIRIFLNKRGKINQKIGFGELKRSGNQYAKYDKNLNLIPV
jgi:hypothetical protein